MIVDRGLTIAERDELRQALKGIEDLFEDLQRPPVWNTRRSVGGFDLSRRIDTLSLLRFGLGRGRALAKACGVSRTTVHHWLCGTTQPSGQRLDRLAQVLRVSPSELLDPKPIRIEVVV